MVFSESQRGRRSLCERNEDLKCRRGASSSQRSKIRQINGQKFLGEREILLQQPISVERRLGVGQQGLILCEPKRLDLAIRQGDFFHGATLPTEAELDRAGVVAEPVIQLARRFAYQMEAKPLDARLSQGRARQQCKMKPQGRMTAAGALERDLFKLERIRSE